MLEQPTNMPVAVKKLLRINLQTRTSQMRRSRFNLRRGLRVLCQRRGRIPISDAEVARYRPRVLCQTRRLPDADLASFVRRGGRLTWTSCFNSNAKLSSSAFQHRREPMSSASQHQSKVRVQRETRISAITDSHELGRLHPIFSPYNGE